MNAPQITAADIDALFASPVEEPVLYIKLDEDTGRPGGLDVWAAALVPYHTVVVTQEEVEDMLGGDVDAAGIAEYLPMWQETVDDVYAGLVEYA